MRDGEHRRAEVESHHFDAMTSECEGDVAGAAAQVERTLTRLGLGKFEKTSLPMAVQPETLQIVNQIVARRNGTEEVIDLCGALGTGFVILIGHSGATLPRARRLGDAGTRTATYDNRNRALAGIT